MMTKLRKPRINGEKRKIIVKRAASGYLLREYHQFFWRRTTISAFEHRSKKWISPSFCEQRITHGKNIRRGGNIHVRIS
jgi:hypothetical protein